MLDGLLGRSGFCTKCKSLIKQMRTRIEVLKRKRSATQKFMRKDIADLLANGLEINAYARAEGLMMDVITSSCYEFIDHVCEIILKHLPVLQKQRDCPEDCREAVASIMFAAARFSDLPELCELRDLFLERYGSSLKYYVNRTLVDNITLKPPSMEKKIQLMNEIALQFSVWWDCRTFVEKMSKPSATVKNQQCPGSLMSSEKKVFTPYADVTVRNKFQDDVLAKSRCDANRKEGREFAVGHQMERGRDRAIWKRDNLKHDLHAEHIQVKSTRKRHEDLPAVPKYDFRNAIPPPYVKPRKSQHDKYLASKHAIHDFHADSRDNLTLNPGSKSDKSDGVISPENKNGLGQFTEIYYKDASSGEFSPRRRPPRRKHSRSLSTVNDKVNGKAERDEERVVRQVSTSRRKHESRKGLQFLVDDEHYKKDKEEWMIDKLLLHYSRKPSSVDPVKLRKKTHSEVKDAIKSPQHKAVDRIEIDESLMPMTSRSMSFPPRQMAVAPPQKVFARASSFKQNYPTKHVHPKLPDYDDLAARFAALKANKG